MLPCSVRRTQTSPRPKLRKVAGAYSESSRASPHGVVGSDAEADDVANVAEDRGLNLLARLGKVLVADGDGEWRTCGLPREWPRKASVPKLWNSSM